MSTQQFLTSSGQCYSSQRNCKSEGWVQRTDRGPSPPDPDRICSRISFTAQGVLGRCGIGLYTWVIVRRKSAEKLHLYLVPSIRPSTKNAVLAPLMGTSLHRIICAVFLWSISLPCVPATARLIYTCDGSNGAISSVEAFFKGLISTNVCLWVPDPATPRKPISNLIKILEKLSR